MQYDRETFGSADAALYGPPPARRVGLETMDDSEQLLCSLRQQLQADLLLGVAFAPIPRKRVECVASPAGHGAASEGTDAGQGESFAVERPPQRLSATQKRDRLRVLDESRVRDCRACCLHETRTRTVFGQGNPDARLVFVGEAPGYEEDRQGLAFVGRAGQLLTRMIAAMGLDREEVFICNVLKCRPPENRDPSADEILSCSPYLREQLETIQPEVVVALGAPAAKTLLNTANSIGRLRGRWHEYYLSGTTGMGPSIPLMPTYHPAYLLRNAGEKRKTWEDLQMVMERLRLPVPS